MEGEERAMAAACCSKLVERGRMAGVECMRLMVVAGRARGAETEASRLGGGCGWC